MSDRSLRLTGSTTDAKEWAGALVLEINDDPGAFNDSEAATELLTRWLARAIATGQEAGLKRGAERAEEEASAYAGILKPAASLVEVEGGRDALIALAVALSEISVPLDAARVLHDFRLVVQERVSAIDAANRSAAYEVMG